MKVVSQRSLLPTFLSMGAVPQPELCKYNLFLTLLMRVYKELLLKLRAFSKCGDCFQRLRQRFLFTIVIIIYGQQGTKAWLPESKMAAGRRVHAMNIGSKIRVASNDFETVSCKT